MDIASFRQILTTFADSPADIDVAKGTLLVQLREDLVSAQLVMRQGDLHVVENDDVIPATRWIIDRVARLPLLAERIINHVNDDPTFVTPEARLLDQIDQTTTDDEIVVNDATVTVSEVLERRPAGAASVLYLTSDAGEGKTTLISHIARLQARKYKNKESDWLLVPVSLGGRTFMRFDDVIIGALMNRLRFNLLFYDAFIELVKLGVVVPALDGFEEMFVEGSAGDAMSALGNLMTAMQSSGSVLIAARKAYFEFKNLRAQTKLFDSLNHQSVTFARLALCRWNRSRFMEYARRRGTTSGEQIYDDVAASLDPSHPLLTRAVLVKRLLEIADDSTSRETLLQRIKGDPSDYFNQFIGSIISREATEKWIDKVGEPAQPLITTSEHYELLGAVAYEMWVSATESLPSDVITFVAEIFTDGKKKDNVVTRQIVERLPQHALLVQGQGGRITFDHQEFYHFFLGQAIGSTLSKSDVTMVRHAFRQGVLPQLTIETAALFIKHEGKSIFDVVGAANKVCEGEPRMSLVKDNVGGILLRLMEFGKHPVVELRQASFPLDAMKGKSFADVTFVECYFQRTSLEHTELRQCNFVRCEFEGIDLRSVNLIESCAVRECDVHLSVPIGEDVPLFAPDAVADSLRKAGFTIDVPQPSIPVARVVREPDEEVRIMERLLRLFMRSTAVSDHTISVRLGAKSPLFFRDVLPALKAAGILVELPLRSGGAQRFGLAVRLEPIAVALEQCEGQFDVFMRLAVNQ